MTKIKTGLLPSPPPLPSNTECWTLLLLQSFDRRQSQSMTFFAVKLRKKIICSSVFVPHRSHWGPSSVLWEHWCWRLSALSVSSGSSTPAGLEYFAAPQSLRALQQTAGKHNRFKFRSVIWMQTDRKYMILTLNDIYNKNTNCHPYYNTDWTSRTGKQTTLEMKIQIVDWK